VSMQIVQPLMGHAPWKSVAKTEKVTVEWESGVPVAINDQRLPLLPLLAYLGNRGMIAR